MEIADVQDRESLQAFLEGLDGDNRLVNARRVAYFTASRTLPVALGYFLGGQAASRNITAAPLFGSLAIACAASTYPTPKIDHKAAARVQQFAETSADAADTAAANSEAAAYAKSAGIAAYTVWVGHDYVAHAASRAVEQATAHSSILWTFTRMDLETNIGNATRSLPPIWRDFVVPEKFLQGWEQAKLRMEADSNTDWSFWILWYERVLSGRDVHADKLAEILNPLREDDWKKGPAHINPLFDDLLALYREEDLNAAVAATPMGEVVEYVPARDVLVLRPQDQVSEDYLDDVREQIASAVRIFSGDEDHNLAGSLRRELRILEEAQTRHAKRPVLILQDVRRVLDRLDHKERSEGLPSAEADADIADFRDVLSRVQIDLIALSPEVRAYHEATKPAATPEECALIAKAAEVAKRAGDEELAAVLQETADALQDPNATAADRRSMFYAAASRLTRMMKLARSGLKEGVSLGKDVVFATTVLKWLSDQPVVKEAIKVIVEIFLKP